MCTCGYPYAARIPMRRDADNAFGFADFAAKILPGARDKIVFQHIAGAAVTEKDRGLGFAAIGLHLIGSAEGQEAALRRCHSC